MLNYNFYGLLRLVTNVVKFIDIHGYQFGFNTWNPGFR